MEVILNTNDRKRLLAMVTSWVNNMEDPDERVIGTGGDPPRLMSPRELLGEAERGTPVGNEYIDNVAQMVVNAAFEKQLRSFTKKEEHA